MFPLWPLFASCAAILSLSIVVRRWMLNKLSAFPGPWVAAFTGLYRAYYDVVKFGGLLDQLQQLHKQYGPVVRIGPNELHFQSPSAFFDIYCHRDFTKEPTLYNSFPFHEASISYVDRREAARRRELLGPLFSRTAILKVEAVIQEKINKLIRHLERRDGEVVDLHMAIRSATIDIIAQYCFAKSFDALDYDDFRHPILVGLQTGVTSSWILKYIPVMLTALENAPDWLIDLLPRENQFFRDMRVYASNQIERYLANPESLDVADQATIFHHLLSSPNHKPSRNSLMGETMALLAAGHDTVGGAFTVGAYHVLSNKGIRQRLAKELSEIWPDPASPMTYQTLEKLPYLTAVIKESLRMSHGVVSNLPRVTGEPMNIAGYEVPEGTIVSMSAIFMHWNPDIFSEPLVFNPQRWLQSNSADLSNYLVSFSRGSRMCLGESQVGYCSPIHVHLPTDFYSLAWCELYLLFGHIFRRMDLTPVNMSSERDYKTFRDFFVPVWDGNRLHVRVNPAPED